jgi:UDP-N-acetylmuramate dehydrogenase
MKVQHDVSLRSLNTFGIDVKASRFAVFSSEEELMSLLDLNQGTGPVLILGGGSNILFTRDFDGLVLCNRIPEISVIEDREDTVLVRAGAGVVWHDFVMWTLDQNLQGIENLSLIPGLVGAAPIQNIGAYGVELKDTFYRVDFVLLSSSQSVSFNRKQCSFGYRDSVFKNEYKGKTIITSVTLELNRKHELNTSYGAISQELQRMGVDKPGIRTVSEAVCNIRRSKLPDPAKLGNAGSFFKNPEISVTLFEALKKDHPGAVAYPVGADKIKLAAGWLIEQCGWRGKVMGRVGSHRDQALVLVNYGNATGIEILELAQAIIDSVKKKFGIQIEPEVNII